jgi:hypothetical protein
MIMPKTERIPGPLPPEWRMECLTHNFSSAMLLSEVKPEIIIEIYKLQIEYLKECSEAEARMYGKMLEKL